VQVKIFFIIFTNSSDKIQLTFKDNQRPINVDNWSYKARNVVLFNHLDEAPLTMQEHIDRAKTSEIHINKKGTRFKNEQQKAPDQVFYYQLYPETFNKKFFELNWG